MLLKTIDDVIVAASNNERLVCRMELLDFKKKIVLEFPVKYINFQREKKEFQIEIGPILIPDNENDEDSYIEKMNLAFTAFNH